MLNCWDWKENPSQKFQCAMLIVVLSASEFIGALEWVSVTSERSIVSNMDWHTSLSGWHTSMRKLAVRCWFNLELGLYLIGRVIFYHTCGPCFSPQYCQNGKKKCNQLKLYTEGWIQKSELGQQDALGGPATWARPFVVKARAEGPLAFKSEQDIFLAVTLRPWTHFNEHSQIILIHFSRVSSHWTLHMFSLADATGLKSCTKMT